MAVTLKDIAEKAGVSTATVSRALNKSPRISQKTQDRIQRLAKKMSYQPDAALASLAAYRNRIRPERRFEKIALLTVEDRILKPPTLIKGLLAGMRERCAALGFSTELMPLTNDKAAQVRLSKRLYARGFRGVIFLPARVKLTGFDVKRFSVVGAGEQYVAEGLHTLIPGEDALIREIYRRLKRLGYRNIGFQNESRTERKTRHLFYASYIRCRILDGLPLLPPYFDDPSAMPRVKAWLDKHRFDAIIGATYQLSRDLNHIGYTIPETLGFATHATRQNLDTYQMAGCEVDFERIGRHAVDFLQSLIQNNVYGLPKLEDQHVIRFSGRWRDGPSVRDVRPGKASKGKIQSAGAKQA